MQMVEFVTLTLTLWFSDKLSRINLDSSIIDDIPLTYLIFLPS